MKPARESEGEWRGTRKITVRANEGGRARARGLNEGAEREVHGERKNKRERWKQRERRMRG